MHRTNRPIAASCINDWRFLAVLSLCLSCAPKQQHGSTEPDGNAAERCHAIHEQVPAFSTPSRIRFPKSELTIHAQLNEEWLNQQLNTHAPITLARESDRDIGAPGRASYTVKRGALTLGEASGAPVLNVPVRADISVCKPLGNACFRYGSCSPEFAIQVEVDPSLNERYDLDSPRLRSSTRAGCRIGIDVTPQLESIVHKELASAQRQLERQWPVLSDYVQILSERQEEPLNLWPNSCVTLSKVSAKQRPLQLLRTDNISHKRALAFAVAVEGQIKPQTDCTSASHTSSAANTDQKAALPALRTEKSIKKESTVYLPEQVPLNEFTRSLLESVGPQKNFSIKTVQLGDEQIYLALELRGKYCGTVWANAKLKLDPSGTLITLSQLSPSENAGNAAEQLRGIFDVLETRAQIKVDGGAWLASGAHLQALQELLGGIKTELNQHALELDLRDVDTRPAKISVAHDGVYVFYPISARATLTGR